MNVTPSDLLYAKALEIDNYCAIHNFPTPLFLVKEQNWLVNFTWQHEGQKHVLSLYYKPTRQSWTLYANTSWLRSVVIPMLEPLCASSPPAQKAAPTHFTTDFASLSNSRSEDYFEEALECCSLLSPFALDNVDCSILFQLTRLALKNILADPACAPLDRAGLTALLNVGDSTDFSSAKEYLDQCLILCRINNAVI